MISPIQKTSPFITSLEEFNQRLEDNPSLWLNTARRNGMTQFSQLGFPTLKDEEWKYTNVSPISAQKFHFLSSVNQKILEEKEFRAYQNGADINIVFVNGSFSKQYSNLGQLPEKIAIFRLAEITEKELSTLQSFVDRYSTSNEEAFATLNRACLNDGTVIKIASNAISNKLIHITHITSSATENIATSPRTLIILEKSSEAEILESHISFSENRYFTNAVTDIFLAENSKIRYYKTQSESPKAFHIGTTRVWQERNSKLETFSFSSGAILTRNNLTVTINGEGADSILNGLYAASHEQHVDNHTLVDHRPPNCTSNQLYKGILEGNATAVFNGKIFVKQVAQKTNSYQLNKNLLLGAGCQVNTKPQLEIFADDVRCTHGATIGQLNEDELFYLQTRAVSKSLAIKMLCRGFVNDVLDKISNETVRARINKLLTKALSALQ